MLLIITVVSVLASLILGWYVLRLRADERRRSEARVAALTNAIDADAIATGWEDASPAPPRATGLFTTEHTAAAKGAPLVKVAVAGAMSLALLIAVAMGNRGTTDESESPVAGARPVSTQEAPLELISMRHEREENTLRVTGLVRNPRDGNPIRRVNAVVFAFNRSGAFVASASAGLDFTMLEPGDESPFVVTVPGVADVGRYRVSFRTEVGVVRHVDRRAEQMRLVSAGNGLNGTR